MMGIIFRYRLYKNSYDMDWPLVDIKGLPMLFINLLPKSL
jgi:hypothetical protein